MRRRQFLQATVTAVGGIALGSGQATAADSQLEPGIWYDATVQDVTDGDTFDVVLDSDGTEYNLRLLGFDSPETNRNSRYEEVREWEGIEDENHLANWGGEASSYAKNEFPDGTAVQIAVDENEDEFDVYDRLLAYVRYDKNGDGAMDTLYNRDVLEQGYARVYGSSLTMHDDFWQAEATARANGLGVWAQSDPENSTEVDNDPVSTVFVPNCSSVRTDAGAIDPARVPVFAESTASQSLESGGVDYSTIPLVGLDESANTALVGGLSIDEALEGDAQGQHQVFLTNLVDHLSSKTGQLLIAGGHREFNAANALSNEDAVVYQRFLEGVGIAFEQVNTFDGSGGNALSTARGIILTNPPQAYTTGEIDALSTFVSDGGAVILMGSADATDTMRSNLDAIAAGLGSDLRLNADQVFDDSSNAGSSNLVLTSNFDTSFPLFDAYADDGGGGDAAPSVSWVNPSDGSTVSGTVAVQLDATDSEDADDSLTVEYSVDGGSPRTATYDSTSGYYEDSWDSTTVGDGDHTLQAQATDSAGNTGSATVTVTADNSTGSALAVSTGDATNVGTDSATLGGSLDDLGGAADATVYFEYGESGTSLDATTSSTVLSSTGSFTIDVSGLSAGTDYEFRAVADASDGDSDTGSTNAFTTAGGSSSAPTIDSYTVTEAGSPNPHAEITADWTVGDADGDLSQVQVVVEETGDTSTTSVGGSSGSGSDFFQLSHGGGTTYTVTLTVTDAAGNSTSSTESVSS